MLRLLVPATFILLAVINLCSAYGLREYEEDCDPDEGKYFNYADEAKKCKSEQGLHCNEYSRRCRCHPSSGALYNWDYRRCELPVDSFCAVSGVEFKNICVDYAECTCGTHLADRRRWYTCKAENGYCKCRQGFHSYRDRSGCYWSSADKGAAAQGAFTLALLGAFAVLRGVSVSAF